MVKQKTLSIILLLFVLSTGYLMRHSLPAEPVEYGACFMDDVQNQIGTAKVVHHIAYLPQSKVKFSFTLAEVIHIICVVAAIVVSKRKSYIEYCGKKMVRAIMLNFHPKLPKTVM